MAMIEEDPLDVAFWRKQTYEYRDMRAQLRRLVKEWRESDYRVTTTASCADELEKILRKSVATKTIEKETPEGGHNG